MVIRKPQVGLWGGFEDSFSGFCFLDAFLQFDQLDTLHQGQGFYFFQDILGNRGVGGQKHDIGAPFSAFPYIHATDIDAFFSKQQGYAAKSTGLVYIVDIRKMTFGLHGEMEVVDFYDSGPFLAEYRTGDIAGAVGGHHAKRYQIDILIRVGGRGLTMGVSNPFNMLVVIGVSVIP